MTTSSSQIHTFDEVTDIRDLIRRLEWNVVYTQASQGELNAQAFEIHIGNCLVFREHYGCHIVAHGTSTPHGFGVMVVQEGVGQLFGEEITPDRIVLFGPGSEIDAVGLPGVRTLIFVLPMGRVTAAALKWGVELMQAPRALLVKPGIDRLRHLRTNLDSVNEMLDSRDLSGWRDVEKDLVATFVGMFDSHALSGQLRGQANRAAVQHALAARSHICDSPPDQLDLLALAQRLGISRHHLNRCFREHYGVSVHDFVHICRLHQARNLLMTQAKKLSVTQAAYECGFKHLGRFAAEYRDLFGETPSQTLRLWSQAS